MADTAFAGSRRVASPDSTGSLGKIVPPVRGEHHGVHSDHGAGLSGGGGDVWERGEGGVLNVAPRRGFAVEELSAIGDASQRGDHVQRANGVAHNETLGVRKLAPGPGFAVEEPDFGATACGGTDTAMWHRDRGREAGGDPSEKRGTLGLHGHAMCALLPSGITRSR